MVVVAEDMYDNEKYESIFKTMAKRINILLNYPSVIKFSTTIQSASGCPNFRLD